MFPLPIAVDSPVKMGVKDASTCGKALHRDLHSGIGLPFLDQTSQTNRHRGRAFWRSAVLGMSPTEMVNAGEDLDELGGYFIINGNERVLRFVIQQKTNYPIALKRESFRNREIFATDLAVLLRSQR